MPGPRIQVLMEHEMRFSLKAATWPVLTWLGVWVGVRGRGRGFVRG